MESAPWRSSFHRSASRIQIAARSGKRAALSATILATDSSPRLLASSAMRRFLASAFFQSFLDERFRKTKSTTAEMAIALPAHATGDESLAPRLFLKTATRSAEPRLIGTGGKRLPSPSITA